MYSTYFLFFVHALKNVVSFRRDHKSFVNVCFEPVGLIGQFFKKTVQYPYMPELQNNGIFLHKIMGGKFKKYKI